MRTNRNTKSILWIAPLTVVFFCFGLLLMAQFNTAQAKRQALENESSANLAMIIKGVTSNKEELTAQLAALKDELKESEALIASGKSLNNAVVNRILTLSAVTGDRQVTGPGITVTITGESNLMYYDLIDLINELFASGAEAIAINETRFTTHTSITEKAVRKTAYDGAGNLISEAGYVPLINGKEVLYPIVIKAIGSPATLETGLTYPGGIIESLNSLYMVYPVIKQMDNLLIPAAPEYIYKYAQAPATGNADSGN
ncbi:MAG: DUF881 domain-containing protein [Clostridia bacterium]|nr:DUF881 domain-containing protein [Clostridia bacterium]